MFYTTEGITNISNSNNIWIMQTIQADKLSSYWMSILYAIDPVVGGETACHQIVMRWKVADAGD